MPQRIDPLIIEFLRWVALRPRTYTEAMEAWRSTCPRHTTWEDALADDLIRLDGAATAGTIGSHVVLTERGSATLREAGDLRIE